MSQFFRTLIHIGLPVALSHFMTSSLNLVDTFMIGGLGENAIAGVGVANRLFFLFSLSMYGIYSGCGIFTSQYWGQKNTKKIHQMMGIMLTFGGIIGVAFTLGGLLFPHQLISLFIDNQEVVQLGANYLRIVAPSYLMTTIAFMYSFTGRTVHVTYMPMIVSGLALMMNTGLNYLLINGIGVLPTMGIQGAALATTIARTFELMALIIMIYTDKNSPLKASPAQMFCYSKQTLAKVIRTGYPVFINEATWALGNTVYFIAYGYLGTSALAVVQITYTVSDVFQAFFMGLGSACGVMVGNEIGKGNFDKAYKDAKLFLKMTLGFSLVIVVFMILTRPLVLSLYKALPLETSRLLYLTLAVTAIYQLPKMFTFTMIVGVLRSGGDTHFCLILDLVTVWLVGVPLGFIGALWLNLPVYWVVALVFFEEWVKVAVTIPRFISKKWLNLLIQ